MLTAQELSGKKYNNLTAMIRDYCSVHNYLCSMTLVDANHTLIFVRDLSTVGSTKEAEYQLYFDKYATSISTAYGHFVEWVEREFTTKPVKDYIKNLINCPYGAWAYTDSSTIIMGAKGTLDIDKVIFNDPATIVMWKDGTKTVVKCNEGDTYDPEKGLAMAISKKALGNKGNYYNTFAKWLPEEVEELNTKNSWDNLREVLIKIARSGNIATHKRLRKTYSCEACKHRNVLICEEPCISCCAFSHWEPARKEESDNG